MTPDSLYNTWTMAWGELFKSYILGEPLPKYGGVFLDIQFGELLVGEILELQSPNEPIGEAHGHAINVNAVVAINPSSTYLRAYFTSPSKSLFPWRGAWENWTPYPMFPWSRAKVQPLQLSNQHAPYVCLFYKGGRGVTTREHLSYIVETKIA